MAVVKLSLIALMYCYFKYSNYLDSNFAKYFQLHFNLGHNYFDHYL